MTTPLVASATCVGADLQVTISAGDANFDITGTGPNLPVNNVGVATHTITGPSTWLGVTVTELSGNGQSINLGNYACPSGPGSVSITTCDFPTLQAAVVTANIGG
ncbi:MAG TPA: hypothetical protein PLZ51_26785, partial [Aggregatilineales bacterium]|nr:hypothetical protein [Aggregatilineales bacterium]